MGARGERATFLLGVVGGIGQSWHTRLLVETVLSASADEQVDTALLDLSETPIDFAANRPAEEYSAATRRALELAGHAEGFVFGSPIYRATYTGAFKNFFDLMPVEALLGKAAALVATGASFHHFLALDIAFRPIMTFFNMHTVPGVLYGSREQFLPERAINDALREQAEALGRDLVYMTRQLAGRGWGPPSPGVGAVTRPR
ncbi:MAG TPA: NAD(P)H-dependent oxidoreductase [Chloroflexota bacterium]|nr:NAD(P)H-dependent oxidoreductase [Chloroflexota bacterium]